MHIELRSVVPSLKSKQTHKNNENQRMKILPLLGQDECGLCVHTHTHTRRVRLVCVHTHTAAPGKSVQKAEGGREENMLPASHQESSSFHLRRLLFRLTLGQPKIMLDLLFKALKTFLILRNTG